MHGNVITIRAVLHDFEPYDCYVIQEVNFETFSVCNVSSPLSQYIWKTIGTRRNLLLLMPFEPGDNKNNFFIWKQTGVSACSFVSDTSRY